MHCYQIYRATPLNYTESFHCYQSPLQHSMTVVLHNLILFRPSTLHIKDAKYLLQTNKTTVTKIEMLKQLFQSKKNIKKIESEFEGTYIFFFKN